MTTDKTIRALMNEAAAAGDDAMARTCQRALDGEADARDECEWAVEDAAAQVETVEEEADEATDCGWSNS
jgi:hypothetical protein